MQPKRPLEVVTIEDKCVGDASTQNGGGLLGGSDGPVARWWRTPQIHTILRVENQRFASDISSPIHARLASRSTEDD
jgi:hypothetical protein